MIEGLIVQIAEQGVLGLLLAGSIFANVFLFKQYQSAMEWGRELAALMERVTTISEKQVNAVATLTDDIRKMKGEK